MKISLLMSPFNRYPFLPWLLFLSFCCAPQLSCANVLAVSEEHLSQLDHSLAKKHFYEQQKLQRIDILRHQYSKARGDRRYRLCRNLYEEFSSYQYDSAYAYARQMGHLASRLHSRDYTVEAQCDQVFCLLSAGLYKEAFDTMEAIRTTGVLLRYRILYFKMSSRLNYDIADYCHAAPYQEAYIRRGRILTDSLLRCLQPGSQDYLYAVGMRQMKERQYTACVATFKQLLRKPGLDLHTKAIITSCLGWVSVYLNHEDQAIDFLAQAAIADNQSVTRETTALSSLASFLYKRGDIERSTRYVQEALANATFYGARQRMIEISSILPIIEQDRFDIVKGQRNAMTGVVIIAVLFIIVLFLSWLMIRRQMHRLKGAQQVIAQANSQLAAQNRMLEEVNKIKDEYIGQSFYINSEYINKVEKLYRSIDHKIAARQYQDLQHSLTESELIQERKSMFADFDETFLKLFPSYLEQYNAFFDESEQKWPESKNSLTTEMRIFALIRLGITDSERIARFLNYSVHTINTYKTRVKNKSKVSNDQFEECIMAIGH